MAMKRMAMMAVLAMAGLAGIGARVTAQDAAKPAVGSQVDPGKAYDGFLKVIEGEMMSAAKAMPAEKYDFNPKTLAIPGAKFDGVRTFADQVKHVAQANYYFYGTAGGMKPDADLKAIGGLKTKDEIVAALAASFVFAHKAMMSLTSANANEVVKAEDFLTTRSTLAGFGIAHAYDHYGQIAEYLRMNGIVPPSSAK